MTKEEFKTLKVGDVVYWATYPQYNNHIVTIIEKRKNGAYRATYDYGSIPEQQTFTLMPEDSSNLFFDGFEALWWGIRYY